MNVNLNRLFHARVKRLPPASSIDSFTGGRIEFYTVRFCCGRPLDCPGLLGYISSDPEQQPDPWVVLYTVGLGSGPANLSEVVEQAERDEGIQITYVLPGPDDLARILTHPRGYFWDADNEVYRVCSNRKPRRPAPPLLSLEQVHDGSARLISSDLPDYHVVGQFPWLPATVICPVCGLANRIERLELNSA